MSKSETRCEIVRHMARAFFACAWADYEEEYGDTNLSGCDVMDVMPDELEPSAVYAAFDLCVMLEKQHGMHLTDIFEHAREMSLEAAIEGDYSGDREKSPEMFGHYAAMGAMGHGVNLHDALGSKAARWVDTPWREYGYFEWCDERFPIAA